MAGSRATEECEEDIAETDGSDRWIRYKETLGSGSFKVAYKGFDKKLGLEIAWNKVNLSGRHLTEEDRERLHREVEILKSLDNPYIIKCYGAWRDPKTNDVNFVTELFTSGTLRDFRWKHKNINVPAAVSKWGKNILQGLQYLHTQNPPIIHRDLKCDNIFINGHSGEVKIADLGLASLVQECNRAQTVIGTPEFMAPELYDEHYDERVDIYAFGMVLLELVTLRFPYDELKNPAQIFKAVSSGMSPISHVYHLHDISGYLTMYPLELFTVSHHISSGILTVYYDMSSGIFTISHVCRTRTHKWKHPDEPRVLEEVSFRVNFK